MVQKQASQQLVGTLTPYKKYWYCSYVQFYEFKYACEFKQNLQISWVQCNVNLQAVVACVTFSVRYMLTDVELDGVIAIFI